MKRPGSAAATDHPDIGIAWYGTALVLYITLGFFFKFAVLNWIVGPLFLLITLYILPRLFRGTRRMSRPG